MHNYYTYMQDKVNSIIIYIIGVKVLGYEVRAVKSVSFNKRYTWVIDCLTKHL